MCLIVFIKLKTLIKLYRRVYNIILKKFIEETSYYYAIKSYNKLGEYSDFSYTNATTLEYKEPPVNFKVKTFINTATIFLNTFNKFIIYQPKYSIFCLYNNYTQEINIS